jgi:FkbM family methyltransferase
MTTRFHNYYRRWLQRSYLKTLKVFPLRFEKIGSSYGGWFVPVDLIKANWICYLGGVGEDITFDLGLIERFNCQVFAFDPTPRAIRHVEEIGSVENFHFLALGLWSSSEELRFYVPKDPSHVSHSVTNLQDTEDYFVAKCDSVDGIMTNLGHQKLDLLKLDIEGAEHKVTASFLQKNIFPKVICIEFDQPDTIFRMLKTHIRLHNKGYKLLYVDGWNLTFVHKRAILQTEKD